MKHKILGGIVTLVLILGVVSVAAGPNASAQLSKGGIHVIGNGAGALQVGIPEFMVGYREVVHSGGVQDYVADYPALDVVTPAQVEKAKADKLRQQLISACKAVPKDKRSKTCKKALGQP